MIRLPYWIFLMQSIIVGRITHEYNLQSNLRWFGYLGSEVADLLRNVSGDRMNSLCALIQRWPHCPASRTKVPLTHVRQDCNINAKSNTESNLISHW